MKKSVYLDATIPSHYFDERASIKTFIDITGTVIILPMPIKANMLLLSIYA
jgi:hypothetical protein